MAGDWIKMRRGLRHDPKVIAMSRELGGRRDFMNWWSDPIQQTCHDCVTEIVTFANVTRVTVCALLDVWASLNNAIKADGHAPFMCIQDIDDIAEIPGFGEAMRSVGWVQELQDTSLVFPNFTEHNTTAKDRETPPKTAAQRAKDYRDRKRENEAVTPSRHVTLEKRREEKSIIRVSKDTLVITQSIGWNPTDGWSGITNNDHADWKVAYPACDASRQLASMSEWLRSNPARAKKTAWRRFITAWLNREQERGGDLRHTSSNRSFSGYSSAKQTANIDQLMGGRTLSITDMSQTAKIEQPNL